MKRDPAKLRAWKQRSKPLRRASKKRSGQNTRYLDRRQVFLDLHPTCPVTGERTTQIHHSAQREGDWLNLQRYWIAVSMAGHQWIEDHKSMAEVCGLIVRVRDDYRTHLASLLAQGIDPMVPVFYTTKHEKAPYKPNQKASQRP